MQYLEYFDFFFFLERYFLGFSCLYYNWTMWINLEGSGNYLRLYSNPGLRILGYCHGAPIFFENGPMKWLWDGNGKGHVRVCPGSRTPKHYARVGVCTQNNFLSGATSPSCIAVQKKLWHLKHTAVRAQFIAWRWPYHSYVSARFTFPLSRRVKFTVAG